MYFQSKKNKTRNPLQMLTCFQFAHFFGGREARTTWWIDLSACAFLVYIFLLQTHKDFQMQNTLKKSAFVLFENLNIRLQACNSQIQIFGRPYWLAKASFPVSTKGIILQNQSDFKKWQCFMLWKTSHSVAHEPNSGVAAATPCKWQDTGDVLLWNNCLS